MSDPQLPAQPASVRTAVRLMVAVAVVGLLGLLVTLTTVGDVRARAEASGTATASEVDVVVAVVVIFSVLLGVVGAALWVLVAVFCGRGRSWARVFATVLAALDGLANLSALGRDTTGASLVGVVQIVLSALVIVFLHRRTSRDYFTSASMARDRVALRYPPVPPVR